MAEEQPGGVEAAEADDAREEEAQEQEQQQERQDDPVETLARELGWRPKDEFRGAEDDWRSAADFIREGREVQRSLSRELRGVRDEVSRISRTSASLMADKLAERDAYWQDAHRRAVKDGDQAAAERAIEERVKIRAAAPSPEPQMPPETAAFVERHKSWFNVDPLATMRAQEVADSLAKRGVSVDEQLRQAERAIRKEFPEHFPAPAKTPPATQTGRERNAAPTSRKKGYADMPADSQKLAREYKEQHGIPLEKFAESYWQDQERKVG